MRPALLPLLLLLSCKGKDEDTQDSDGGSTTQPIDVDGDGFSIEDDCDDANPAVHPGASEVCNGLDDDCDARIDDADDDTDRSTMATWYLDADGDGFGTTERQACERPDGHAAEGGDCDDANPALHPGASEVCDGLDNDCDDLTDEEDDDLDTGTMSSYFIDADGDGYGGDSVLACSGDTTILDGDCDDSDPSVNPSATEVCDGVDNDCDSTTSETGLISVDGVAYSTVAAAAAAAGGSREILLCDGTYTTSTIRAPSGLRIRGVHGRDVTTLRGEGRDYVIATGGDTEITGLTVENGRGEYAGALYAARGGTSTVTVRMSDCRFQDNQTAYPGSGYGGAATMSSGVNTYIDNCEFTNNYSGYVGGAIGTSADLHITNSQFIGNSSLNGGAIYIEQGELTTDADTVFDSNSAVYGGALVILSATAILDDATQITNNTAQYGGGLDAERSTYGGAYSIQGGYFEANSATTAGGAVYMSHNSNSAGNMTITNNSSPRGAGLAVEGNNNTVYDSSITDNVSTNMGGGIIVWQRASGTRFEGVQLLGNQSGNLGGAVYLERSTSIEFSECDIQDNVSSSYGAGLYLYGSSASLSNSTVLRNQTTSANGGGLGLSASSGSIAASTFQSFDTDWGEGATDNSPDDIFHQSSGDIYSWDGVASFTCDATSCAE